MSGIIKMTARSIRRSVGRYIALVLIVFLSAGFFAGLKLTTGAMINAGDVYLREQHFYDFRLMSTLGMTDDDVDRLAALDGVTEAEGSFSADILVGYDEGDKAVKLISMPTRVNLPSLVEGRMPSAKNEVVADADRFSSEDIGTTLRLSEPCDSIEVSELLIVGLVDSPLYLTSTDRGTTGIGNGSLHSFLYIPDEAFVTDVYTEVCLTLDHGHSIYSDEYDDLIASRKEEISSLLKTLASERYDSIYAEYVNMLAEMSLTPELVKQLGLEELAFTVAQPQTYTLTRNENTGYLSFENDTAIVGGVANIFPIFFILIALLVCITTMTRMVDEERTEIGTLKAMGFGSGRIIAKYLMYAGSATLIGWAVGYFVCTWGIPALFWYAYGVLYGFSSIPYYFSLPMMLGTLAVSLAAILGATAICCYHAMAETPASLIRPRAAKVGKRVLLERIRPLWKRLRFLDKITLRNMFRYKQRLFMMLVGIGCCAGLVLTAFGVRDSMVDIGDYQYGHIQNYDMEVSYSSEDDSIALDEVDGVKEYLVGHSERVDTSAAGVLYNNITLMCYENSDRLDDYWRFEWKGERVDYPAPGEVIINNKIAEKLELEVGDVIEIQNIDMKKGSFRVGGIFKNHVYSYILMSEQTYNTAFGEMQSNIALLKLTDNVDRDLLAEQLTSMDEVTTVNRTDTAKETIDSALGVLNYIIWLVIGFSAALAFIVIFNLTNINIAERSREIATVQVLGFYPRETSAYVLRENLVLSVIATLIGMPLGILFHRLVMGMVIVDSFSFNVTIRPLSYALAIIFTVAFAAVVNLFMRRHIAKIKMAESLKAVE